MFYSFFLISTCSFAALALYDYLQIVERPILTILFSIFGYTGVISSIIFLILSEKTGYFPTGGLFVFLWGLAAVFVLLLAYTTFFAFRFGGDGAEQKSGRNRKASAAGMYGLVRHPGFYWFTLLIIDLIVIFRTAQVLSGGMYLILLNFGLILLEDRVLFPRIFSNYRQYQEQVPFLIPEVTKDDER